MSNCPTCGWPVADDQDVIEGRARYADTQGGHNDRHTLVVEEAERAVELSETCYWHKPHTREPDSRLSAGCGWRTLHRFQPNEADT